MSELTESEKQQVSALSQLAGGISTSNGVFLNKKFIPAQPTRVPFHSLTQNGVYLPARNLFTVINNERNRKNTN
ncbi:VENN motif pre-toxin domain-containing protein [Proteus faecis]|uniref:VENN motif pre-toxin domain-containing protein n=1 Tax=Proteus faecis TaxID=2050967 RepID=UPI001E5284DE|nr:VENN motif pre-toxin domain-containing protein [Proteus faecis]MCT8249114.1 VENN motif pre-toxin domain-containing protein [Proteus faecis]